MTKVMEAVGKTKEVRIMASKNGRSTGRGVVEFLSTVVVERCLKELDGTDLDGRSIQVTNYLDKQSQRKSKGSTSEEEIPRGPDSEGETIAPPPDPAPPHTYAETTGLSLVPGVLYKKASNGSGGRTTKQTPEKKTHNLPSPVPKPNLRYGLAAAENFKKEIGNMGLAQVVVKGDGWCLFHAIAVCINRKGEGLVVMAEVIKEMRDNADEYAGFVEDNQDLETHIRRILSIGWAGQPEIRAASKIYGRPIEI